MDCRMRNACREGDIEYIKKDIESFKHIYFSDKDYPHPLFFCACGGQNAAIEFLCSASLMGPK